MKKYIQKIQLCLLAAVTSGCSALDMRCDNVSDRVGMHAGSEWYIYLDTSKDAAQERQKSKARPPKALLDRELPEPPVSMYCAEHNRHRQKTPLKRMSGGTEGGTPPAATADTPPKIDDGVCRWRESGPEQGEAVNAQQAKDNYLLDQPLRLDPGSITVANGTKKIRIHLINEGLNCAWSSTALSVVWPCEEIDSLALKPPSDENQEVLEFCLTKRPPGMTTNYIGVVDRRFCLFLGLFEVKPENPKFMNKIEDDWYTEISHDRLKGELWCAEYDGPVQPGVVVGGPRLNFRVPIAVETQASPNNSGQMQ